MNIYELKNWLEQNVESTPQKNPLEAAQAWDVFKTSLNQGPDEAHCEELGFSMSAAVYLKGGNLFVDEDRFQIYFGRLIDAKINKTWRTAEIIFYYRYEMNARLIDLLSDLKQQDIETAFCSSEEKQEIFRKVETVFNFADRQQLIWDEVRRLKAVQSSFHFWIQ
ncbi:MAG: hypothetical protein LWX83_00985 [Anaerolineae bacterium]|nr:hypothetical protein [Anaerolineae bacterium]